MAIRKIVVIEGATKPEGRPGEVWRPIPGYDGYEASNQGRIRSVPRIVRCLDAHGRIEWRTYSGKILSPSTTSVGYPHVQIGKGNYDYSGEDVHKLVMLAFVGSRPPDHEIAHYDGDRRNVHLSNLRYATYQQNYEDQVRHGRAQRGEKHYNAKLTSDDVRAIRRSKDTNANLSKKYGVSKTTVYEVRNYLKWRWLIDDDTTGNL